MLATACGATVAVWDPSPNIPVQLLPRWSVAQSGVVRCVRWNHTNQVVGVSGDGALLVRARMTRLVHASCVSLSPSHALAGPGSRGRARDVLSAGAALRSRCTITRRARAWVRFRTQQRPTPPPQHRWPWSPARSPPSPSAKAAATWPQRARRARRCSSGTSNARCLIPSSPPTVCWFTHTSAWSQPSAHTRPSVEALRRGAAGSGAQREPMGGDASRRDERGLW
jgi:hypothetical protein